jgi:hypothetical protein
MPGLQTKYQRQLKILIGESAAECAGMSGGSPTCFFAGNYAPNNDGFTPVASSIWR